MTKNHKVVSLVTFLVKFQHLLNFSFSGEIGYVLPCDDKVEEMVQTSEKLCENVYKVPSENDSSVAYLVDMFLGSCECEIGNNGAPCKHQCIIWSRLNIPNPNFMPYFDKGERMRLARMAVGDDVMNYPDLFEGLRDSLILNRENSEPNDSLTYPVRSTKKYSTEIQSSQNPSTSDPMPNDFDYEEQLNEAKKHLAESTSILGKMIEKKYDKSLYDGLAKFNARIKKFSKNQTSSALCKFGSDQFASLQIHTSSAIKRSKWRLMNVQPTSVARRKNKSGGKKQLKKGGNSQLLPVVYASLKKKHSIAQNMSDGVLPAKKHAQDMKSKFPIYKPAKSAKNLKK